MEIQLIIIIFSFILGIILFFIYNFQKLKNENKKLESILQNNNEQLQLMNNVLKYETQIINQKHDQLKQEILNDQFDQKTNTYNLNTILSEINFKSQEINNIKTDILEIKDIFKSKSKRGTFGEISLYNIMYNIFGNNKDIYVEQFSYKNLNQTNVKVDLMSYGNQNLPYLPIDAKFPLENYLNEDVKKFKQDIKKHINDINEKYIDESINITQAMMFIPSETIFNHIMENNYDLVMYAQQKNIWIVSPNNIVYIIKNIFEIYQNFKKEKNIRQILQNIQNFEIEINNLNEKISKIYKTYEKLGTELNSINKINKNLYQKYIEIEENNE